MNLHFDIVNWCAVSDRLLTQSQWQLWAEGKLNHTDLPISKPDLSFIPPNKRRRLSAQARMMLAALWPLTSAHAAYPLVYVSHDGEVNRSFAMWLELLGESSVSPMAFGLSVHNALPGQWSILQHNHQEISALCASEQCLETGIIEAMSMLLDGAKDVLLLISEDPLKPEYDVNARRAPFPFALAMHLRLGHQWQIHQVASADPGAPPRYWQSLNWIKHVLRQNRAWQHDYQYNTWHWQHHE
ncbi:beta-ketoacyl synthase chain length factor [Suttonella sp. R2A3]|uniref:beta-ketoacyl synthase chain length factor n=1 Tax=Suttonella sp. R2A3 TaxID=2908648 RepID=UPI001F3FA21F|nr:beta-ketoacyl synthase chain length factor [Suttonella sp. R2A3]UJF23659.1 beta-ketoacyl synthase chain length factor [Suttonella sp. R2A3]